MNGRVFENADSSVILSGAGTSRSEIPVESKDPYSNKNAGLSLTAGGFLKALFVLLLSLSLFATAAHAQTGGELRFCLRNEPKTFDPLLVDDDSSLSIRYLTGGVLIRENRKTQHLEPDLAESWNISRDGTQIK